MNPPKISIKDFRSLLKVIQDRIPEEEEGGWKLELEYGRETFVPKHDGIHFSENRKTGEKCVIIQITRDI